MSKKFTTTTSTVAKNRAEVAMETQRMHRFRAVWLRLRHGPPPDAPPPEQPSDALHWALNLTGNVPFIACLAALLVLSVYLLRHRQLSDQSEEREEEEEEEEGEPTHHDASQSQQRGAALYEVDAMASAPMEPAPCLSPGAGGPQLQSDGLVCLGGVVSDAACAALLHAVNTQLAAELEAGAAAAVEAADADADAEGAVRPTPTPTPAEAEETEKEEKEDILGAVLCRQQRYDLKLCLQQQAVRTALVEVPRTALVPYCLTTWPLLVPCYLAALATLLPLLPCYLATLLPCYLALLLSYCPAALLPYCPTALLPYCPTALLPLLPNLPRRGATCGGACLRTCAGAGAAAIRARYSKS